jgi:hypothetical protein
MPVNNLPGSVPLNPDIGQHRIPAPVLAIYGGHLVNPQIQHSGITIHPNDNRINPEYLAIEPMKCMLNPGFFINQLPGG